MWTPKGSKFYTRRRSEQPAQAGQHFRKQFLWMKRVRTGLQSSNRLLAIIIIKNQLPFHRDVSLGQDKAEIELLRWLWEIYISPSRAAFESAWLELIDFIVIIQYLHILGNRNMDRNGVKWDGAARHLVACCNACWRFQGLTAKSEHELEILKRVLLFTDWCIFDESPLSLRTTQPLRREACDVASRKTSTTGYRRLGLHPALPMSPTVLIARGMTRLAY